MKSIRTKSGFFANEVVIGLLCAAFCFIVFSQACIVHVQKLKSIQQRWTKWARLHTDVDRIIRLLYKGINIKLFDSSMLSWEDNGRIHKLRFDSDTSALVHEYCSRLTQVKVRSDKFIRDIESAHFYHNEGSLYLKIQRDSYAIVRLISF